MRSASHAAFRDLPLRNDAFLAFERLPAPVWSAEAAQRNRQVRSLPGSPSSQVAPQASGQVAKSVPFGQRLQAEDVSGGNRPGAVQAKSPGDRQPTAPSPPGPNASPLPWRSRKVLMKSTGASLKSGQSSPSGTAASRPPDTDTVSGATPRRDWRRWTTMWTGGPRTACCGLSSCPTRTR
jgi:hypothetical protein